jgi:PTS system N-acetylglucosamine-specific IIC component
MNLLDIKLGFTFSAGLFDYVLNFGKATHPLWLLPIGAVYGAIYYGLFRFFILKFDLKTPGREDERPVAAESRRPRAADAGPTSSRPWAARQPGVRSTPAPPACA